MYSNPTAVIVMVCGELLMIVDSSTIDFDDKGVTMAESTLQDIAQYAKRQLDITKKLYMEHINKLHRTSAADINI